MTGRMSEAISSLHFLPQTSPDQHRYSLRRRIIVGDAQQSVPASGVVTNPAANQACMPSRLQAAISAARLPMGGRKSKAVSILCMPPETISHKINLSEVIHGLTTDGYGLLPGFNMNTDGTVPKTRLPNSWTSGQLQEFVRACFPRVLACTFHRAKSRGNRMHDLPDLAVKDFGDLFKFSKLYIVPTEVTDTWENPADNEETGSPNTADRAIPQNWRRRSTVAQRASQRTEPQEPQVLLRCVAGLHTLRQGDVQCHICRVARELQESADRDRKRSTAQHQHEEAKRRKEEHSQQLIQMREDAKMATPSSVQPGLDTRTLKVQSHSENIVEHTFDADSAAMSVIQLVRSLSCSTKHFILARFPRDMSVKSREVKAKQTIRDYFPFRQETVRVQWDPEDEDPALVN